MSDEQEGKRGPGAMILAIVGLIIGLAGGGAAVYFLVPQPATETAATAPEDASGNGPAPAIAEEAKDSLHVTIRRFAVPLINQRGETLGYMWLDIDFVVDGPTNQSLLSARKPKVKSAMLKALHDAPTTSEERPGALDVDMVEKRMRQAADAAAGNDVIYAMYITNVERAPN